MLLVMEWLLYWDKIKKATVMAFILIIYSMVLILESIRPLLFWGFITYTTYALIVCPIADYFFNV